MSSQFRNSRPVIAVALALLFLAAACNRDAQPASSAGKEIAQKAATAAAVAPASGTSAPEFPANAPGTDAPAAGEAARPQDAPTAPGTDAPAAGEAARPQDAPTAPGTDAPAAGTPGADTPAAGEVAKEGSDAPGSAAPAAPELPPDTVTFAILETNDVHGYILPQKVFVRPDEKKQEGYEAEMGGYEWLAGYLRIAREHYAGRVLLLDGGDMFQGTMISNRFEGATVVEAMNRLGYAAAAIGNHEFDFGPEGDGKEGDPYGALKARGAQAKFPLLAANILDRQTGNPVAWPGFAPYALVTVDGIKIGIVGGATKDTPTYSGPSVGTGLEFLPLDQALLRYAPELRSAGAKIIIGLLHAGGVCEEFDKPDDLSTCEPGEEMFQVARALPPGTVDLLIGGHTHHVMAHRVNGIPVIQAAAKGTLLGMAEIHFSPSQDKVVRVDIRPPVGICHHHFQGEGDCAFLDHIPSTSRVPATFLGQEVTPVPFFQEVFTQDQQKVLAEAQEKLGARTVRRIDRPDEGIDHPIGLLTTRVILDSFPDAQIAMLNESGIRAGLPEGELTLSDIFEVFPFDSSVAYVRMPGDLLLDLLRLASSGAHGLPVIRGLRLVIDLARDDCIAQDWDGLNGKEKWERNLLVSATLEDGAPIASDATYVIMMSSYLAAGGSDFKRILSRLPEGAITFIPDAPPLRELVIRWLKANPAELGGPSDPYTTSPGGKPLVTILNWNHVLGSTCGQPAESPR